MDKIIEFSSCSIDGYSRLIDGVELLKNNDKQVAIVKDVYLENKFKHRIDLMSGELCIGSTSTSCKFVGSEIVGKGAGLSLKIPQKAIFNEFYAGISAANIKKYNCPTIFYGDKIAQNFWMSSSGMSFSALGGNPSFIAFDNQGNFYFCIPGSAALYKRTGGVSGVQSSYSFGTQAICYDGDRYIYSFSSNQVYCFDTLKSVVSSASSTLGLDPLSSYASALDGRVFLRVSNSNTANYLVDPVNGGYISLPGVAGNGVSTSLAGIGKDSNENYIVWQLADSLNILWWNLGKTLISPLVRQSGTVSISQFLNVATGIVNCVRQIGNLSRFFIMTASKIWIFDCEEKSITPLGATGMEALSSVHPIFVPKINEELANKDFGTVRVKVSGVISEEENYA